MFIVTYRDQASSGSGTGKVCRLRRHTHKTKYQASSGSEPGRVQVCIQVPVMEKGGVERAQVERRDNLRFILLIVLVHKAYWQIKKTSLIIYT